MAHIPGRTCIYGGLGVVKQQGYVGFLQNSLHIFYEAIYKCSMKRFLSQLYSSTSETIVKSRLRRKRRCGVVGIMPTRSSMRWAHCSYRIR